MIVCELEQLNFRVHFLPRRQIAFQYKVLATRDRRRRRRQIHKRRRVLVHCS